MITQNFINLMSLRGLFNTSYVKNVKKIDGSDALLHRDSGLNLGTFSYNKKTYYDIMLNENSLNMNGAVFGLGSGTREPSIDDFSLESVFDDNVFIVETFNCVVDNSYKPKYIFTITYKYTGTDTITISEVGMFTKIELAATSTGHYAAPLMLAREVLETPITVSNGDIFTVTMTLS